MKYSIPGIILIICIMSVPAAAQLAGTAWPMFHHDLNRTGLSTVYGPDTPSVNWTYSTGDRIFGSAAIGADGTIYIGTRKSSSTWGSKLCAINPDGTEKWHWSPYNSVDFIDSTPAVASDGTIYIGSWNRYLYALYPNGTKKWELCVSPGGFVLTSPAVAPDGTIYIGNKNNNLYAINPNGSLKWTFATGKNIESSPAVGHDGTVYAGSNDGKLYAINPDGSIKWSYTSGGRIKSSPAIGADGTVYVGSNDGKLYAIYSNGTLKWSYTTGDCIISSPAIGAEGMVYVGSNDGKLYAIYPNGTLMWEYVAGAYISSSPAIDADGTVYVGSFDGHVHAINPNGTLLWKYDTGDKIFYSSPTIAYDGMVYIGNEGGNFYAFGPGTPPNRGPVLDPVGDMTVNETETLLLDLNASDPDVDPLTYSCNRTDLFTDFDPVTGTGNWITDYDDSGVYWVDFGVSDSNSGTANETIRIEILNVNRQPVLGPVGDMTLNETETLLLDLNASDQDGDMLTYSTFNLPPGAAFDTNTQKFSWTPTSTQAGTYPDIHFEVSDGTSTDSENITLTVNNVSFIMLIEATVPPGCIGLSKQFDVAIQVDPMGASVYGVEYELTFDPTAIHAEWQTEVDFLMQGGTNTNVYTNNIENNAGTISFAATRKDTGTGATQPGTLSTIHFTAIKQGANTTLILTDVKASDPGAQPIPVDINNSEVEVCDNKPPVAIGKTMFKYNNVGTKYISKAYFDGSESNDTDGNIINYIWYFGDGNYGAGETYDHVYGTWNWNGVSYDPFEVMFTVEDDATPMMDNSITIPVNVYIAGDANGDGEVDIFDATITGLEWGHMAAFNGDTYWYDNERGDQADLNNDQEVDIFDAVIIGANWGHTAW